MRLLKLFPVMATVVSTMFIVSCADDVYDPNKERPTPPAENPLGEGFAAPDGFRWSMMNTVNLNVEVKDDEFNGQYKYLIEVFTSNPLSDDNATPIAAGIAGKNENFTSVVSVPSVAGNIYIRQTDPKQRKEIYAFEAPANGGSLNCKLYYTGSTRAAGNTGSAFEASKQQGFIEPDYTVSDVFITMPSYSDDFLPYNPGLLSPDANYIIGKGDTYKGAIRVNNRRANVFVEGVWDLSGLQLSSSLDIHVMDGGKIIGNGNITIHSNNTLTVRKGGTIESNGGIFNLGSSSTKVYGSITGENIRINTGTPEVYIAAGGQIKSTGDFYANQTNIFNFGVLSAQSLQLINNTILLNESEIKDCEDIVVTTSQIYNYGKIAYNGKLETNNNTKTGIINHDQATISGKTWNDGASVYNDGLIQLDDFNNTAMGSVYNSCAFIIRNQISFVNLTLDNGSITSDWSEINKEWLPVPTINCNQKVVVALKNGSIIKADKFILGNAPNSIIGEQGDISMIKARQLALTNGGKTSISGNMVLELAENIIGVGQQDITCATTGYDESKHDIESCSGILNNGNPGEPDPSDPEFPIVTEDATNYTFAFEDNWPTYGDFDLNDIIVTIDKVTVTQNANSSVGSYKIEGTLQAVGASKKLGLGIQFLGFNANTVTGVNGIVQGVASPAPLTFEGSQSKPVLIISTDAHHFLGNMQDDRTFINTITGSSNNANGANFEISITFRDGTVTPADININKLDMFVISRDAASGTKRTEIHLAGFAPTDLGNTNQFGDGNDNSSAASNRYYLSKENLAWGIVVPTEFAWPLEYRNIKDVYENFEGWVTSAGKENKDWYNNHNGQVFPKK